MGGYPGISGVGISEIPHFCCPLKMGQESLSHGVDYAFFFFFFNFPCCILVMLNCSLEKLMHGNTEGTGSSH